MAKHNSHLTCAQADELEALIEHLATVAPESLAKRLAASDLPMAKSLALGSSKTAKDLRRTKKVPCAVCRALSHSSTQNDTEGDAERVSYPLPLRL